MIDFRREIKRELKRLGWSAYRLAKASGMPLRGVQAYIEGTRDATGERLSKMLTVLEFELKRPRKKGR
ncbi:MAG: helix-turn-helix transcriptional regulator [Planctomycetes bacterium]|nr:helix-turn-helix transcriptional regulator [Planctomycetota bacterium]